MKNLLYIFNLLLISSAWAQLPDTIYANEHNTTAVFFPREIRQAVVGSEDFIFSYNQEHPQYFGLLTARPGVPSNLLVLTRDGEIYSFAVSYRKKLPEVIHFVPRELSLGNEVRPAEQPARKPAESIDSSLIIPKSLYRYLEPGQFSRLRKLRKEQCKGISMEIKAPFFFSGHTYFFMELINRSPGVYRPLSPRVFLESGMRKKNASYQKLPVRPLAVRGLPKELPAGSRGRFLLVLPELTLEGPQRLLVSLEDASCELIIPELENHRRHQ